MSLHLGGSLLSQDIFSCLFAQFSHLFSSFRIELPSCLCRDGLITTDWACHQCPLGFSAFISTWNSYLAVNVWLLFKALEELMKKDWAPWPPLTYCMALIKLQDLSQPPFLICK
jgi:hypothetical protein